MNLIYLGTITERIPVIPMFIPTHIGGHVPPINFGEVFDIPRLSKALRIPIVEWHEMKNLSAHERDEIGCWSVWQAVQEQEQEPRKSFLLDLLDLGQLAASPLSVAAILNFPIYRMPKPRPESKFSLSISTIRMPAFGL